MTDQRLYRKTLEHVYEEESVFIRAPQGHSGKNLDVVSHKDRERLRTISVPH